MREKESNGKKPVRRSKSEENEKPKTYSPRTAKFANRESKIKEEVEPSELEAKNIKPEKTKVLKSKERGDYARDEKRPASRKSSQSGYGNKNEESKSYKPRTFKTRESSKPKKVEDNNDYEKKPYKSVVREKREPNVDSSSKSFYEEKFGKPKISIPIEKEDRREKRIDKDGAPKIVKSKKAKLQPPVIEGDLKTDKDGFIRLNKYIANSGLCSRREADAYIENGFITVNGKDVKELGTKVKLTDEVRFKGKSLDPEKKVYILLNKPKDYITTVEDPNATKTVMDLISGACEQRVYPVGRLDRNSTGLLLLTNDGELTKQLTHPSFMKKKVYEVGLDKEVSKEDIEAIRNGISLDGEVVVADAIEFTDTFDRSNVGIEIHSGQNRVVRRIFEKLGYRVQKLDRVYFAGLTKKNLPRGKWRFLSAKEVSMLKTNRFE